MKKGVISGVLLLAVLFTLWQLIAGDLFNPAEELAVRVDKEKLTWFTCSTCGKLFMAEETTRRGYCPYCEFQMMLVTEDKRVLGKSVDESEFVLFFSPKCGKPFFAYETQQMGRCPHCGEAIDLTAHVDTALEEPPHGLVALTKTHLGKLLLGASGLFVVSVASIYILLERRVILLLEPIQGALSEETRIKLSRWQSRKKKLTLGDSDDDDVVLNSPSLKDIHCTLSFVRVGGKTRTYLHQDSNQPIWVNDKPQYNPRLKDRDKVRIGEVVFEVHTHDK